MPPRLSCSARSSVGRALQRTTTSAARVLALTVHNATRAASRHYATAGSPVPLGALRLPDNYIPPTQPPSARRPEQRKAQLLRSYTAMLRSMPLMLLFQHNNLTAVEWAAVRRELRAALAEVPPPVAGPDGTVPVDITSSIEFQVLRTRMFNIACKIVDYFKPEDQVDRSNAYTHDLSKTAYESIKDATVDESSTYGQISPLITGPIAAVTFPSVSPAHLAAVLKVLSPSPPAFPAPTRKKNPGYYDPIAQSGFQKLILIGGRIEDKVFDLDGVKWVGGIQGGLDGLRAQLVSLLQHAGLGLTTALEGHGKGLWLALESRRTQLEEESGGGKKEGESSPPEHSRPFSPPVAEGTVSPRASLDRRQSFSPSQRNFAASSPPPLQHPQPQRSWHAGYASEDGLGGAGAGAGGGIGLGGGGGGFVSEFDTSLGIRLDYEAVLAYIGIPPLGAIILLILERKSDYVRFHAWQSSLVFTVMFVVHLLFSWSTFLSWVIVLGDLALIAFLALRAYRDADTLDRFEVPVFGSIASRILDDE
ncbi:hypothetical protein F5B21DRAFT_521030 [Xylaria acuta]|nr:hypothetical protein F5B21DRAFT_521030 [Xylaria acuta]